MKKLLVTALAVSMIGHLIPTQAAAQGKAMELEKDENGQVLMTWEQFKKVTNWVDPNGEQANQNAFVIPWQEIQELLGLEIKDVGTAELKLPWKEFKTLLEWSVNEAAKEDDGNDDPVPVPYLITSSEYVGTGLSKDGAQFKGTFKVEILEKKGWKKIPVLPATVAVSKAALPDNVFLVQEGGYYTLMTKEAGSHEITIEFSAAAVESGGAHVLSFAKIASGSSVLDITIPEKDVEVSISGAQSTLKKQVAEGTRVVAALPSIQPVYVKWERAIAKAAVVPPKLYSETRTLVSVADGLLLGQAQISYSILHTPTRQLELNLPEGVSVLEVVGRDVRDWRAAKNTLTVQLNKETIGTYVLNVKFEAALAANSKTAPVPVITAKGVQREKGHVGIVALTNVEVKNAEVKGANLIDVKGLPAAIPSMTSKPILLGYRYVDADFGIELEISKHSDVNVLLTVIDDVHFTTMQTIDGRRITHARYSVRNNRNQFLRLKMPEGAELWSATVADKATQPASDEDGRVLLPLVRSQGSGGLSSFPVELVYAEQGTKPDAKGSGKESFSLPVSSEPIMHVKLSLYLPKEGRYRKFGGSLREVEEFSALSGPKQIDMAQVADNLVQQQVANVQTFQQPPRGGADAVKIQLPLNGKIVRFEKVLAIQDAQTVSFEYSNLKR